MGKAKERLQIEPAPEPVALEDTTSSDNLQANLKELQNQDGVVGYIMRNSVSASIDLKDPTKIIDYAVLSSSSIDAGEELSKLFNLGATKSITVEGKSVKMISTTIDQSKVSIFMEKNAKIDKALKKLHVS